MLDIPPLVSGDVLGSNGGDLPTYRIHKLLGKGGAGCVFRAEVIGSSEPCVIKVPRSWKSVTDVFNEARYIEGESFPNIARIRTLDWAPHPAMGVEVPFLVLDAYSGSLYHRLAVQRTILPFQALRWIADCVRGLQAVQLIHRDLKPENILLDAQDRAYVCDFGLAIPVSDALRKRSGIRISGPVQGTLTYMSPEQIYEAEDIDCRSDIYNLGLILYEMITGVPAHAPVGQTQSPTEYLHKVALAAVPHRNIAYSGIAEIVRLCTANARRDRYDDYWALLDAVEEASASFSAIAGG